MGPKPSSELVRKALDSWDGPKDEVRVITKAGLARPKGRWMPAGRPEKLRAAVEGSLQALLKLGLLASGRQAWERCGKI